MRFNIYYDHTGTILSMIEARTEPTVPRNGMRFLSACNCAEVELTGELRELSPIEIHTRYRVEREDGDAALVPYAAWTGRG